MAVAVTAVSHSSISHLSFRFDWSYLSTSINSQFVEYKRQQQPGQLIIAAAAATDVVVIGAIYSFKMLGFIIYGLCGSGTIQQIFL